jgi:glutamine amidotransferase-like uncharacterized protein
MKKLENLKQSVLYALHSRKGLHFQYKVVHAAFKRAEKQIGSIGLQTLLDTTSNTQHQEILRLLYQGLNPKAIVNRKRDGGYVFLSNRGKKYTVRTIQKIRENALKKVRKNSKNHP